MCFGFAACAAASVPSPHFSSQRCFDPCFCWLYSVASEVRPSKLPFQTPFGLFSKVFLFRVDAPWMACSQIPLFMGPILIFLHFSRNTGRLPIRIVSQVPSRALGNSTGGDAIGPSCAGIAMQALVRWYQVLGNGNDITVSTCDSQTSVPARVVILSHAATGATDCSSMRCVPSVSGTANGLCTAQQTQTFFAAKDAVFYAVVVAESASEAVPFAVFAYSSLSPIYQAPPPRGEDFCGLQGAIRLPPSQEQKSVSGSATFSSGLARNASFLGAEALACGILSPNTTIGVLFDARTGADNYFFSTCHPDTKASTGIAVFQGIQCGQVHCERFRTSSDASCDASTGGTTAYFSGFESGDSFVFIYRLPDSGPNETFAYTVEWSFYQRPESPNPVFILFAVVVPIVAGLVLVGVVVHVVRRRCANRVRSPELPKVVPAFGSA